MSPEPLEPTRRTVFAYGGTIAVAVIVAFMIRFFAIEAYRIPTGSMRPTLEAGDTIFVSKWIYGLRMPTTGEKLTAGKKPQRGDVVVYNQGGELKRDSIKRIVAIDGDRVEIKGGKLKINGVEASSPVNGGPNCGTETLPPEGYKHAVCWEPPSIDDYTNTIDKGFVLVMGDLRTGAPDPKRPGRNWSIVPYSAIRAKALWTWLSVEPVPPRSSGSGWFPKIRFERMFRRIE